MRAPLWIFLDFDGVIMDSMTLKLDAYCFALQEYGFARENVRVQQLLYAGLSRSRALPLMFESLAGRQMPEDAKERVLRLFSEEDDRLRSRMQIKPGALAFMTEAQKRIPLVVVTGTPQEAIDKTMEHFDLVGFFQEVCGYPPIKAEHLQNQLLKRGLKPEQSLYVGDAIQDYKAAESVGMPFVGINNGDNPFAGLNPLAELNGLEELSGLLGWT